MAKENKTQETDSSVNEFVQAIDDEQVISDCQELIQLMTTATGHEPKMWGPSIIGFGSYHYIYESGREGDAAIVAFSPRKGKLTVYVDDGEMERDAALFSKLGKHTTSKVCIYIKRLEDIDLQVLAQIVQNSYNHTKALYDK